MKKVIYKSIILCLLVLFGFVLGITTQKVNANNNPSLNEIQYTNDPQYRRVYVNGRYYIVFWNAEGLSAVKE